MYYYQYVVGNSAQKSLLGPRPPPHSARGRLFLYFLNVLNFLYLNTSLLPYFVTSIFSIPIYGRKTSGTTIDPSAC